jgi:predicted NUDIX family NTP pyrophosphohydrolase
MALAVSAGVLAWRPGPDGPEFLLVHPGGPYWARKDEGAWGIPKGMVEAGEDNWAAATREFEEEVGQPVSGHPIDLTPCRTSAGKVIHAWLVEADLDLGDLRSNLFEMEWPPRSGRREAFPEVDRAAYFDAGTAARKLHKGQRPILAEALRRLVGGG